MFPRGALVRELSSNSRSGKLITRYYRCAPERGPPRAGVWINSSTFYPSRVVPIREFQTRRRDFQCVRRPPLSLTERAGVWKVTSSLFHQQQHHRGMHTCSRLLKYVVSKDFKLWTTETDKWPAICSCRRDNFS